MKLVEASEARGRREADEAIVHLPFLQEMNGNVEISYMLAEAYMSAGDWEKAIDVLNRVISARGVILVEHVPLIWPMAFYKAAICHERLGNRQRALELYSRFLKLWDEADTDLRAVSHAKNKVSVLSTEH